MSIQRHARNGSRNLLQPDLLLARSHAFERIDASAALIDGRGVIIDTNESWRLFSRLNDGDSSETGIGVDYLSVCDRAAAAGVCSAAEAADGVRAILRGQRVHFDLEYECNAPVEERWFRLHASAAPLKDGCGAVILHVEITGIKLRELQLWSEAERDSLTGLPNRVGVFRALERALAESDPVTVLFVDIDGFKAVNDTYGHHVGDELLIKVANRLYSCVRSVDMVCRLGGDEFVVICPALRDDSAPSIAGRMSEVLGQPFQIGPDTVQVGASVGHSTRRAESTVESMLRAADAEMYRAKRRALRKGRRPSDVTAAITTRQRCRDLDRRLLYATLERSSDLAMLFEPDGTIAWASPASKLVLRIAPDRLIGRRGLDFVHPDDTERVMSALAERLRYSREPTRVEFRFQDSSGELRWLELTMCDLVRDPDIGFYVGNVRDVTEARSAQAETRRAATVDELTGLPNRSALRKALSELQASAEGKPAQVGLLLFDVDGFSDVNHALGNEAGDAFLREVALRVRSAVPAEFTVARFGADRFAVLVPSDDATDLCHEIGSVVQSSLIDEFRISDDELRAAVSVGFAVAPIADAAHVMDSADAALGRTKKTRRGGITEFRKTILPEAGARLRRTAALRRALSQGEIIAHYQPVVELTSGRVVGVEALSRWHVGGEGWVPPDDFIPIAENTGLIDELGIQILRRACHDAASWTRDGYELKVAVNVSGMQLKDPRFPTKVDAALREAGLPAHQLVLEITETAAICDPQVSLDVLATIRDRGVTLCLDDLGTGYAGLAALRDLPVDAVKLDRSFTSDLGTVTGDGLASAVLQLSSVLGRHVVAEGVETPAQAARLRELGCDLGQGFLWSPAVPPHYLRTTIARIEREFVTISGEGARGRSGARDLRR